MFFIDIIIENYNDLKKGEWGITKTAYKRSIKKGEEPVRIIDRLLSEYEFSTDNFSGLKKIKKDVNFKSDEWLGNLVENY